MNLPPFMPPFGAGMSPEMLMRIMQLSDQSPEEQQKAQELMRTMMTHMMLSNYRNYLNCFPPFMPPINPLQNMLPGFQIPNIPSSLPSLPSNNPLFPRGNNPMNDFLNLQRNPLLLYQNQIMENLIRNRHLNEDNNINSVIINRFVEKNMCFCKKNAEKLVKCNICQHHFHMQCLKKITLLNNEEKNEDNFCVFCYLNNMDPLSPSVKQILPLSLLQKSGIFSFNFALDSETLQKINENESFSLEIRCIRLNEHFNFEISWPDIGLIHLNGNLLLEFQPLQYNSCLKRRKDEKISIKRGLLPENEIKILIKEGSESDLKNFKLDTNCEFLFSINLVKKLEVSQLKDQIILNNLIEEKQSKQHLKDILNVKESEVFEEISTENIKISLLDPMDFQMITIPAKGRYCKHVNCFSLDGFLTIVKESIPRKWKCPICRGPAFEMRIDGFLWEVLRLAKREGNSIKEMIFFKNGEFDLIETNETEDEEFKEEDEKKIDKKDCLFKRETRPAGKRKYNDLKSLDGELKENKYQLRSKRVKK